jgi:hypothetical protein
MKLDIKQTNITETYFKKTLTFDTSKTNETRLRFKQQTNKEIQQQLPSSIEIVLGRYWLS